VSKPDLERVGIPTDDTPIYDALRIGGASGDESRYPLVLDLASIIDFRRDPLAAPVPGRALVELPPPEPALEERLAPAVRIRVRSVPVQAILDQADRPASTRRSIPTQSRRKPTSAALHAMIALPAQAGPPNGDRNFPDSVLSTPAISRIRPWEPAP
jgi:hypothetical protein